MRETESPCAENIGLKDSLEATGGTNFLMGTNNVLHNTYLIKKNTTTHALKLFLTRKQKLHEVTCQTRSL